MSSRCKCILSAALLAVVACVLLTPRTASAQADYNYKAFAQNRGCASIIFEDRRSRCALLQQEKNSNCRERRLECDLDKQKNEIERYKESLEKLRTINESDRERYKQNIRDMKVRLDDRRALASRAIPFAESCSRAREAVQNWFADTASLTKNAGEASLRKRQAILERYKKIQERREELKRKLEEKRRNDEEQKRKDPSFRPDDSLDRELDKVLEELKQVETDLRDFNAANGDDVAHYLERLLNHYNDERVSHGQSISDDNRHLSNCRDLSSLGYPDLPF